jgi:hypothetical protein
MADSKTGALSRREFLQGASAAGGAAWLFGGAELAPARLRWLFCGCLGYFRAYWILSPAHSIEKGLASAFHSATPQFSAGNEVSLRESTRQLPAHYTTAPLQCKQPRDALETALFWGKRR